DLRRSRHRLLPVRPQQAHLDGVCANLEPEDRHDEHPGMLRRQPADRDMTEDPHQPDLPILSDEGVVAQGGEPDLGGHEGRRVTKFTRRSGTKIVRPGSRPSSAAFTFGLAIASFSAAGCEMPAGAVMRSRTFPSIWMTIVTSFAAATLGSNAGQLCRCTEPRPPRRSQSSSVMYGANGASSSSSVATPSSRLGPDACWRAFESSIIAATAVLKEYVWRSSVTLAIVRCTARSTSPSLVPAGCASD